MQLMISGVHLEIGEAFQQHIRDTVEQVNKQHNIDPIEVFVQVEKINFQYKSSISFHTARGVTIRAHEYGLEPHQAFNNAMHLVTERLRRHKKRLDTYHKHHSQRRAPAAAPYYVLGLEEPTESKENLAPPVIAELETEVPTLSVGEAVMELDLSQQPALLFYNESHGELNMVYRRLDGNIGWIDPSAKK